jgi:hypothetical protein
MVNVILAFFGIFFQWSIIECSTPIGRRGPQTFVCWSSREIFFRQNRYKADR